MAQNLIAAIFDFDDTLTDDSTSQLLAAHGVDPERFWTETVGKLVRDGWDPTIAWLHAVLDLTGQGDPLGNLTNQRLREFGAGLTFYEGLPHVFDDLRAICAEYAKTRPTIEFYIISGGLEEVILGSALASGVNGVRGCRYDMDPETQVIRRIKNVVNFTLKTRYIFEINKGLLEASRTKPYAVNEDMPEADRRIPFQNMIYVGDGLTDVPGFSLIRSRGGNAFGVFDPTKPASARKAWEKLASPARVAAVCAPRYGPNEVLGALLRAAVRQICVRIESTARL